MCLYLLAEKTLGGPQVSREARSAGYWKACLGARQRSGPFPPLPTVILRCPLLEARHFSKYFTSNDSFNLNNNPMWWMLLLCGFYRWGNRGANIHVQIHTGGILYLNCVIWLGRPLPHPYIPLPQWIDSSAKSWSGAKGMGYMTGNRGGVWHAFIHSHSYQESSLD